jgi:fermentation-respiration switch protein FrsA (DUF1100 family)
MRSMIRIAGSLFLITALGMSSLAATDPETVDDPLMAKTTSFCSKILDREFEAAQAMMSTDMKEAFPPEMMQQVLDQILTSDAAYELDTPWLEEVTTDFRRYRIPLHLTDNSIDMRVVFDKDARVSGFFRTTHDPKATNQGTKKQKAAPGFLGRWDGNIEIPGSPLQVILNLSYNDGYWSGTADIPAQAAMGLPLRSFQVGDNETLAFTLADIPGDPTFHAILKDGEITGSFKQGGGTFPFKLTREQSAGPNRPQEPKPPFPYQEEEVEFSHGDITLAGTLTLPKGEGPFPAAVLVSGSGPQDRNEEIFQHKPFLVIADHLTRAGIAVLRYDDRGVGESGGVFSTCTSEDFKDDALAGVKFLLSHDRIDPERIGMIGHSEGGLIAPMAAVESDNLAFIILLAGPGVSGKEVLVLQVGLLSKAGGVADEYIARIQEEQGKSIDLVLADAPQEEVRAQVRKFIEAQLGGDGATAADSAVDQALLQMQSPWFRFFLGFDPRPTLRQVKIPVLALNGGKDMQVDPAQNLPEIEKALKEGGNQDFTTQKFPDLNHLFQKAQSGAILEYFTLEETVHPIVLETMRDWILERFGSSVSASPTPPE